MIDVSARGDSRMLATSQIMMMSAVVPREKMLIHHPPPEAYPGLFGLVLHVYFGYSSFVQQNEMDTL